jgi:hypothetical protein
MATIRGGKKFEAKLAAMVRLVSRPATLRVGFLENARYPDGTPVAMIAAIQDFGAPSVGIPPRPFFRNMIKNKQGEWPKAVAGVLKANNYDAVKTLEITGAAIAGQLRQSIIDTNSPPLAPSTIQRKGFAKPLVDTGHMLNSVDYEVQEG